MLSTGADPTPDPARAADGRHSANALARLSRTTVILIRPG
jgi:hypothetical protein